MFLKTLRSDQLEAFEKAKSLPGFALLGEQRTGKTPIATALIDYHRPNRVLILTTVNGIVVWKKEFRESLRVDWPCAIRIINHAAIRNAKRRRALYKWLDGGTKTMTVCDEAHAMKRRGSKQSRFIRGCGKRSDLRIAMTGTMIAEGIEDAWAVFNFIHPPAFGSYDDFSDRYLKFGGFRGLKVVGYKNKERAAKVIERYSYRITLREARERAGLPGLKAKTSIRDIDLGERTARIYAKLDEQMYAIVNEDETVTTDLVITQAMKMQQLTGGYVITDSGNVHRVGTEKIDYLEQMLTREIRRTRRVVIVARFLHEIAAIDRLVRRLGRTTQIISGGYKWSGQLDADVGLLQIQSGSAIDLAAANCIIFFSFDYSYINFDQTKFRVLSFNTDRVDYYFLFARDTIDHKLYRAVTSKTDLATLILDSYRRRRCRTKSSRRKL